MATWIVLFIVLDLVVVLVVLWFVLARRRLRPPVDTFDSGSVARFARAVHDQIGDHLRARYSGDPATLPDVLPGLIGRIESRAQAEGLDLRREVIERIVTRSIVEHGVAREHDVRFALEEARPEATP